MLKRVYVGYLEGRFSAWILCLTCHQRAYFSLEEQPESLTCSCGASARLREYRHPFDMVDRSIS